MFFSLFASALLLCLQSPCDGEICMRSPQGLHKGDGIIAPILAQVLVPVGGHFCPGWNLA